MQEHPKRPRAGNQKPQTRNLILACQAQKRREVSRDPQRTGHPKPKENSSNDLRQAINHHLPRGPRDLRLRIRLKLPRIHQLRRPRPRHSLTPRLPLRHHVTSRPRQQRSHLSFGPSHHLLPIRPRPQQQQHHRISPLPNRPRAHPIQHKHSRSLRREEVQLLPEEIRRR